MRRVTWLAIVAGAAIACGRGSIQAASTTTDRGDAGNQQTGNTGSQQTGNSGTQAAVPCDGSVTLMARGVDAGSFTTFGIDVTGVTLTSGGTALTPDWSAAGTTLSLAGTDASELAALKRVAGPVDVTVTFGKVQACTDQGCSALDTCTAPITFRYDVDQADPNGCHVFLQLDLAASVQPTSGGQAFLPNFSAKYW